jgi:hypothetical protein
MLAQWALIIFFHVGPFADGNSNATSVVQGFASQQLCEQARAKVKPLANNTVKKVETVCVQTK